MKKETKMKPYEFNARFEDVDFRRILNENPDADFIGVKWTPRGKNRKTGVVLISDNGIRRMRDAGLPKLRRTFEIGLDCQGHLISGLQCGSPVYIIRDIGSFKEMYQQLMAYENHRIQVNPIR